jgi:hypothetical protein
MPADLAPKGLSRSGSAHPTGPGRTRHGSAIPRASLCSGSAVRTGTSNRDSAYGIYVRTPTEPLAANTAVRSPKACFMSCAASNLAKLMLRSCIPLRAATEVRILPARHIEQPRRIPFSLPRHATPAEILVAAARWQRRTSDGNRLCCAISVKLAEILPETRADFDPNGFRSSSPTTPATQCSLGAVISEHGRTPDQWRACNPGSTRQNEPRRQRGAAAGLPW